MTALGPVWVCRSHGYCTVCGQPGFAADRLLGITGWLTAQARRMVCLAGIDQPFRKAERLLASLAGWSIDHETLRRRCHAEARAATQQRSDRQTLPEQFAQTAGDWELHIDAGKVNTHEGWRDVKVAVLAKRQRGEPTTAANYEQRHLPQPGVRAVSAAVEEAADFGRRCAAEAERLQLLPTAELSVLGDGAQWIWNLAGEHFPQARQVLDVYHAVEHLATAGRVALGTGPEFTAWLERVRQRLVGDGYWGVCEALAQPLEEEPARCRLAGEMGGLLNYLCGHQERLGYAVRLRRGQAIGSGLVEGSIKELVNVRMKRTGARWKVGHVGPFVELLALADSVEWSEYWATTAL
jgi:hypothetical protein